MAAVEQQDRRSRLPTARRRASQLDPVSAAVAVRSPSIGPGRAIAATRPSRSARRGPGRVGPAFRLSRRDPDKAAAERNFRSDLGQGRDQAGSRANCQVFVRVKAGAARKSSPTVRTRSRHDPDRGVAERRSCRTGQTVYPLARDRAAAGRSGVRTGRTSTHLARDKVGAAHSGGRTGPSIPIGRSDQIARLSTMGTSTPATG